MGRLLSGAVLVLAVGYASAAQPRLRPSATLFAATPAEVRSVAASGATISLSPTLSLTACNIPYAGHVQQLFSFF